MKRILKYTFFLLFIASELFSQDTIKIQRPDDYYPCNIVVCIGSDCYADSMPRKLFFSNNNIEVRINSVCKANQKHDIFVSAFEVWNKNKNNPSFSSASSSFMNDAQKKIIQNIKMGDSFYIKNISLHSPDGFRKRENVEIKLY